MNEWMLTFCGSCCVPQRLPVVCVFGEINGWWLAVGVTSVSVNARFKMVSQDRGRHAKKNLWVGYGLFLVSLGSQWEPSCSFDTVATEKDKTNVPTKRRP
mmetsp:Transcript_11911/g.27597  ORF Transcript_11911/g.27597 Transcript_11911/m.27597 type:complete len:100 (+) Transcript_11911:530-829(+)